MFSNKCKKCGGMLIMDTLATVRLYHLSVDIIIDEEKEISDIDLLPEYLVFLCHKCGYSEKRTFEDIRIDLKTTLMQKILKLRQQESYKLIDKSKIHEENGISFCGICEGHSGCDDGYCYNDMLPQCIIRKTHIKING